MSDNKDPKNNAAELPLAGIRVVEFTHVVMGPTCGLILADLGAEVIKIEPIAGDSTRNLKGSGAGFFSMFNRNKKSIAINMDHPQGKALAQKLALSADIVSENFKPGAMAKHGLDYATLSEKNPRLIYVSHKGFLPGPYDHRTALDEVVQMMGGLAYMTGPKGRPLRAGASVNDVMGGMFGALGALTALWERQTTGHGQEVQSALFENCAFLVGQHMMQYAATGKPVPPMPARIPTWGIYDIFTARDGQQIFLAVVTDTQWKTFCDAFSLTELGDQDALRGNGGRVDARPWLIPKISELLQKYAAHEISRIFEEHRLPYAPISQPDMLFDDVHLNGSGGLGEIVLANGQNAGQTVKTPLLPIALGGRRLGIRSSPPRLGQHTKEILAGAGLSDAEIEELQEHGAIA